MKVMPIQAARCGVMRSLILAKRSVLTSTFLYSTIVPLPLSRERRLPADLVLNFNVANLLRSPLTIELGQHTSWATSSSAPMLPGIEWQRRCASVLYDCLRDGFGSFRMFQSSCEAGVAEYGTIVPLRASTSAYDALDGAPSAHAPHAPPPQLVGLSL
jgi:hypothetical protein